MNFDNVVKASVTFMIAGVFLYLCIVDGGEFRQALITLAVASVSYWVGSSSGSAKKDQIINKENS